MLVDGTHIPALDALPSWPVATAPALVPTVPTWTDWSLLSNKVQAGELPSIIIIPHAEAPLSGSDNALVTPLSKVFTVESTSFPLEPEPSALPDCLVQMALNCVFIPLSMLTTDSLNRIETDQVKYKHIIYSSGAGKKFLDEAVF